MKNTKIKCQCPLESNGGLGIGWYSPEEYSGVVHKPNKCKGTNEIKLYERNGKKLYLCSCCVVFGDRLLVS